VTGLSSTVNSQVLCQQLKVAHPFFDGIHPEAARPRTEADLMAQFPALGELLAYGDAASGTAGSAGSEAETELRQPGEHP